MRNEARRAAEDERLPPFVQVRPAPFARSRRKRGGQARRDADPPYSARSCVVYLVRDNALECVAVWPPQNVLDPEAPSAAESPPGGGSRRRDRRPFRSVAVFLLNTPPAPEGIIGLASSEGTPSIRESTLFETVAELIASALERARLGLAISSARLATESKRVRNTLLASISHDFRTPLASILGAATSLIEYGAKLPEAGPARSARPGEGRGGASRRDGPQPAVDDASEGKERLSSIATGSTCGRSVRPGCGGGSRRRGATQTFRLDVEQDCPLSSPIPCCWIRSCPMWSAMRYNMRDRARTSRCRRQWGSEAVLSVTDDGPGSPRALPRIFDKFGSP